MFTTKEVYVRTWKLISMHGKGMQQSTVYTLSSMVRAYVNTSWGQTNDYYKANRSKQFYYLSMDFFTRKILKQNLLYIGKDTLCIEALLKIGIDIEPLEEQEPDP